MKRVKAIVKTRVLAKCDIIIKYLLLGGLLYFFLTSASLKYLIQ